MRKHISMILLIGLIAASCGNAKKDTAAELNDKKVKLQKIREEQKKLTDEAAKLEKEIALLDPKSSTSAAKLVAITTLGMGNFTHYIELQGRVDAQNISYVAPSNGMGGVVKALYVTQGQAVRKGQILAKLDDQMIRQQIEPLKVQLSAAEDTYRRTKNLFDQGIGTYQNQLNAKTQVESLEKQIGIIQKQISLTNVTAPSSGIADQVNVRVGEMFAPSGPQIRIVNTSSLKVVAGVPENYLGRVSTGSKILVVLPEQNNDTIHAVVNVVQKVIDPASRSFNIEAQIPSKPSLKPNQIAQIKILDYSATNVIIVPLNVVQSDEKGRYVYVMVKEGNRTLARKKMVITGESYGTGIEIRSGLSAGEQLITEGYQNLYEGQVITTEVK
jgi:membrane fusion protein (multidrug efflux system)